jgi:hypothetical protein
MSFIPDDRVCLLLIPPKNQDGKGGEKWFYLDIPLDTIDKLCLTPRKYLLYLAWCILGLPADCESLALGVAAEDGEFHEIDDASGDLEGGGMYTLLFLNGSTPGKYSSSAT